nr:hypothetical protein [Tanacetum cinerariifolium]
MVFNSPMLHLLRVEMVINSPWMWSKNWLVQKQTTLSWLVQKQTTLGKDTSNPLIVDSLLKSIWFLINHHLTIEALAIPGQTVTGVNTPRSDEDRLKLMELMVFLLQKGHYHYHTILYSLIMSSLFADTHNVVAILEKSDAADGFEQIIDFLSGSYIHYALIVNPHIYISCIKQFWNTASVKRSGDVTRVRKGFLGVKTPLFNGMLAVRQHAEEGFVGEQVQVEYVVAAAVEENVADDVAHDAIPSPPPHDIPSPSQEPSLPPQQQQSSPQAPLQDAEFPTQLVIIKLKARVKKLEKANKIKSSKLRRLRKVGASRRVESSDDMEDVFNQGRMIDDMDMDEGIELVKDADIAESEGRHAAQQAKKQAEIYNLDLDHSLKVLSMQEDDSEVSAASATIPAAKPSIPVVAPTVVAAYTRRRKGVIVRDPEEELPWKPPAETPKVKDKGKGILVETPKPMIKKDQIELDAEYAKKLHEEINKDYQEFSKDIDWDAAMDHVNQKSNNPQYIKRYQGMKKRPQTESEARKNMMIYLKNTTGYKMDFFKGMTYAQICPIFQAKFDENIRFLFKSREEMEEEDQEIIKSINETPTQKATKRRKLSEETQEAEDLRKHLEVVEDEDDDVFVEATLLASKVPVVDYQIVLIDNKPRFKIIRADETHQFYISFATLLKNFDREDLENL